MSTERVTWEVSIKIDGPDNTEIGQALHHSIETLEIGSGGEGWTKNGTHYTVAVTTNQPTKPMTLPALLEMIAANSDSDIQRQLAEHFAAENLNPSSQN